MADYDYRGVKVTVPEDLASRLPSDYKTAESKTAPKRASKSDDK